MNSSTAPVVTAIRQDQRTFFHSGATRPVSFRKAMLRRLYDAIRTHEDDFLQALQTDLGKSPFEAYSNEVGIVYREIRHALRHLGRWSRDRRLIPDFYLLPGKGRIIREPYGNVLIIAPWNYPMQLLFAPLVAAMAAGNTAVLKPSELTPHTAAVSRRVIESAFPRKYLAVVEGDATVSRTLMDQQFDYIFFTGSVPVGRKVMEGAARHLTPVTLELGGKSPAVVDPSAHLDSTARRIVWGKFNNAGQTCVAPDYILAHTSIADDLVARMTTVVREFYGDDPSQSPQYGRIVNESHFRRLHTLLQSSPVVHGGDTDEATRYIAPTIMYPTDWDDPVMEDEIFGPILPVIPYETLDEAIEHIRERPRPLALYAFGRNTAVVNRLTREISFGGGGVNCTVLHVASTKLPFGGVGPSGMGNYHGKAGFDTFSHTKSILSQPASTDLPLMYPNRKLPLKWLRKVLK
jgi:aldehyde dehydrogenase (NAD+)